MKWFSNEMVVSFRYTFETSALFIVNVFLNTCGVVSLMLILKFSTEIINYSSKEIYGLASTDLCASLLTVTKRKKKDEKIGQAFWICNWRREWWKEGLHPEMGTFVWLSMVQHEGKYWPANLPLLRNNLMLTWLVFQVSKVPVVG